MIEVEQDDRKSMRKVRVVLREDKEGNRIFYSVMDKKQGEKGKKKSGLPHA